VRGDRGDLGAAGGATRHHHHRLPGHGVIWADGAEKHLPQRRGSPTAAQVVHQRRAHVGGQRQAVDPPALAVNHHFTAAPIQILKAQDGDLRRTQAEPGHQQQHRPVPQAQRRGLVTRGQQRPKNIHARGARQAAQPPSRYRRHHRGQVPIDHADSEQVPQQRTQADGQDLHRAHRVAPAGVEDEVHHALGSQQLDTQQVLDHQSAQEPVNDRGPPRYRPFAQPAFAPQITRVSLDQLSDRVLDLPRLLRRDHVDLPQKGEHLS